MSRITLRFTFLLALALALGPACQSKPKNEAAGQGGRSDTTMAGGMAGGTITVKGSDTMVLLAQRWAEKYMAGHPDATIQVTGGGSGTGIAALLNGTTHIANASRKIKDDERATAHQAGIEVKEFPVAMDALSVVVHRQNPVKELTVNQLKAIYTGAVNDWSEVGGSKGKIVRYSRESNSGTYVFFKEHILGDQDYAADSQNISGTAALASAVTNDPNGIGFGGVAYFLHQSNLKILGIKPDQGSPAVSPVAADGKHLNFEVVHSGTYPIARYLYCYTASTSPVQVGAYIEWIRGTEGQKIAEELGYVPLPGSMAAAQQP